MLKEKFIKKIMAELNLRRDAILYFMGSMLLGLSLQEFNLVFIIKSILSN